MKKIIIFMTGLMFLAATSQTAWAQTTPSGSSTQTGNPSVLKDKTLSNKLQKDLTGRNSNTSNLPTTWYDAGYGYYGTYSMNDRDFMARYDRQGNYIETLGRRDWNDDISPSTRSAFDNSKYKDYDVTGYWESTDPNRKGAYYELKDSRGNRSTIWADDQGKFSTQPPKSNVTPKP